MRIHIDTKSNTPVYRQIMDQVQAQIATGRLRIGDRLPSVRELAVDIRINPNTVARAYRELGQLGVVETQGSTGTFVRAGEGMPGRELREEEYRRGLRAALAMALSLGIEADQARRIIQEEMDRTFPDGSAR
jgi:GntR family transcriptional regulator